MPLYDTGELDLTARWIVIEGDVKRSYAVGSYRRLVIHTGYGLDFQADIPLDAAEPTGRVRFGFDSGHVMSL
jgi:hypothetical protein